MLQAKTKEKKRKSLRGNKVFFCHGDSRIDTKMQFAPVQKLNVFFFLAEPACLNSSLE